ncbi:hypothetical protein GCM10009872_11120 [Actinopolymorpha rutila]
MSRSGAGAVEGTVVISSVRRRGLQKERAPTMVAQTTDILLTDLDVPTWDGRESRALLA